MSVKHLFERMAFIISGKFNFSKSSKRGVSCCRITNMTVIKASSEILHIETPLIESPFLSDETSNKIFLKMDNMQPGGSFKIRGHGHLVKAHASNGKHHFISSSGGNAGMAVAIASRKLGVHATIIVPESTPKFMVERLRLVDAEVVVHGTVWDIADKHARERAEADRSAVYVSPFDDQLLWAGHASLVEELSRQLGNVKPAAIVVSVGGGGLFLGVVEGLRRVGWSDVLIVAAETKGADSFARMAEAGHVVRLDSISSIAKSLGALAVSEDCAKVLRDGWSVKSVVVTDREAVEGCSILAVHHRILVEPACGAAVAAAAKLNTIKHGPVVVVVCGGSMTSPHLLAEWTSTTGASEIRL